MVLKVLVIVLLGACASLAERDLDRFVAGRPINHGVPGVVTYGAAPGQIRPGDLTKPLPRPSNQRNSPTPPPGYQPRPQVQPTPPPGHTPVQTLPGKLPQDKTAQLPPKAELLRPFPRPGRPQTLPEALPESSEEDQKTGLLTRPSLPPRPATLPGGVFHPQPLPGPLPQRPQTLPANHPGNPVVLPGTLTEEKTAQLPPKSQLTKPAPRPQPLPAFQSSEDSSEFAPLPTGPQVEPRPTPGELTKPLQRPQVQPVQTLPARLPTDKTAQLPPKSELLKPSFHPQRPQVRPSRPVGGFAPLPDGPQVQPRPNAWE